MSPRPRLGQVWPSLLVAAQAWLAWRALRHHATWPRLAAAVPREPVGCVAVVVPARDEADNLRCLLPSLVALRPAAAEVIVVDDRSRDETATVAAQFPVGLLAGSEPPAGWTGKNWACRLGRAAVASADWLLFTDADTVHRPESLGAALAAAERLGADALSLLPEQACGSFWERLLLPFAYGHYFAAVHPRLVEHDRAAPGILNGQYLLIRAAVYDRVGGHEAVRGSVTEDVALARVLRVAGFRLRLLRADGRVAVRMYRGLGSTWAGFRKHSFNVLRADPRRGVVVAASTALAGLPLMLGWRAWRGRAHPAAAVLSYAVAILGSLPWLRWFGVPPWYAPLQPLAFATFQLIALDSVARSLLRLPIGWKGRAYRIPRAADT